MSLFFILWILFSSLGSFLLAMVMGHMTVLSVALSLTAGLLTAAFFSLQKIKGDIEILRGGDPWKHFWLSVFFVIMSFQFFYLLYPMRLQEVWILTLNPNNRGDLPFHINMIKAFARGLSFWPDNLFLAGERLKYPFGINIFNAQWELLGIPLRVHLMLTGLLCLGLLMRELFQWMGWWGLFCFFFSGGLGSYLPGSDLEFKNLYLSVFVTQRGFLWALPAGIWLIRHFEKRNFWWAFILGLMPFFHLHSFVILWTYFIGLQFIKPTSWRHLGMATILAVPWVLQALFPWKAQSIVHLSAYWWSWKSFGIWGMLLVICCLLLIRRKALQKHHYYVLLLSGFFSILILAPWDWDEIKILIWCYLLLNFLMYETVLKKISLLPRGFIAVLVFFPGLAQIYQSMPQNQFAQDRVYLAKQSDIELAEQMLEKVSPDEVILVAPVYNHAIFFAGQSVVIGYPGHAWSQGTDGKANLEYIEDAASRGSLSEEIPFKAEIKWILSSPFEKEKWPESKLFSAKEWSLSCVKPGQCR